MVISKVEEKNSHICLRCNMGKAISEETKQKISELYKTSDLSTASISQAVGVSERTAQRYKNYDGLDTSRPTRPSETSPTSPSSHDQALDTTGKPSLTSQGDQALDITERPSRPQKREREESTKEYGEPIVFVGGKKHTEIKEESEKEDQEESEEKDEYRCYNCKYIQGSPFSDCPKCGASNRWDENSKSEESEENEYQCYNCDHIQGSPFSDCPKCGASNTFEE